MVETECRSGQHGGGEGDGFAARLTPVVLNVYFTAGSRSSILEISIRPPNWPADAGTQGPPRAVGVKLGSINGNEEGRTKSTQKPTAPCPPAPLSIPLAPTPTSVPRATRTSCFLVWAGFG